MSDQSRGAEARLTHDLSYGFGLATGAVVVRLWPHSWWFVLAFGLIGAIYGTYRYYRYVTTARPT